MVLMALLGLVILSLATCSAINWADRRNKLPEALETERVIYAVQEPSLRETCEHIVYRLTEEAARRVERDGPPDSGLAWSAEPLDVEAEHGRRLLFKGALNGCSSRKRPPVDVRAMLRSGQAHYAIFAGGEGLLVVEPQRRVAVFLYFG